MSGRGTTTRVPPRSYEDIGVLTDDEAIGADVAELFNFLTGYSRQTTYRELLVAPANLRPALLDLIAAERDAPDGHIILKLKNLVDNALVDALYEASQTGTSIDLIVRAICCLRPGVDGLSETTRVRSIVGRSLEHSRIFAFGTRDRRHYFIGSADLMPRTSTVAWKPSLLCTTPSFRTDSPVSVSSDRTERQDAIRPLDQAHPRRPGGRRLLSPTRPSPTAEQGDADDQ